MPEKEAKQFIEKRLSEHREILKKLQLNTIKKIQELEEGSGNLDKEIENAVETGLKELKVFKIIIDNFILNSVQEAIDKKEYDKAVSLMFRIRDIMKKAILNSPHFEGNPEEAQMLIDYLRLDMH